MTRAMSDKFQNLLGDLTVQHMMDVQELRDEVSKLKSENECLKETNEFSEPAVQDKGALEGQMAASANAPIYEQQQQERVSTQPMSECSMSLYGSEAVYGSEDSRWSSYRSEAMMTKEDIKLAPLHRTLNQLDPKRMLEEEGAESLADEVPRCTRLAKFLQSDTYELMVGFIILMN
eukprot:CAMPEP_0115136554 /NCGR_PEP_ID=MMETSP0227-20121206/56450_1 /TAXON_ID=89957 /ORGANISM="Polarella glacialis, Strain CCMP 1383" /LENGTH=175 /DNA_ID=CAMNT_0002543625 /DNA_START=76 /DNA_END=600 /DNA_ORIENTATION=-